MCKIYVQYHYRSANMSIGCVCNRITYIDVCSIIDFDLTPPDHLLQRLQYGLRLHIELFEVQHCDHSDIAIRVTQCRHGLYELSYRCGAPTWEDLLA